MRNADKTKEQLIEELEALRLRTAELEKLEAERKQAREELQAEKNKLQSVVDAMEYGLTIQDMDYNIIYQNELLTKIFGHRLGEKCYQVYEGKEKICDGCPVEKAFRDGKSHTSERKVVMPSGEITSWENTANPIKDARGEVVSCLEVTRNITERKQAEEELKRQKAYFQQLFDNSPEGIALLDDADRVVQVNKGFETLFGYQTEEIKGRFINDIVVPEDRIEEASAMSQATFKGKVVHRRETVRKRKDGSLVDVSALGYPIQFGNKTVGVYAIYSDITERKRAEEERREMEQKSHIASRLASVGEMASGIAHEINNPLTAVIGFAQLLMDADLPDDVKEDIGVIHKEAQRAAGVAKNLLTFARKQAPAKELTNMNSIIEGVLKLRAYEQKVNNIHVNTHLDPKLPEVIADYSQMQQVFINIILNAETAILEAHNGGTLTVTTKKVNNSVKVSFTDSGPGIAKENLNRIFDPFFTTKEVGKGTGLGLSVCHGIIAEHGGRIYARSKLGNGATFVVELPINAH